MEGRSPPKNNAFKDVRKQLANIDSINFALRANENLQESKMDDLQAKIVVLKTSSESDSSFEEISKFKDSYDFLRFLYTEFDPAIHIKQPGRILGFFTQAFTPDEMLTVGFSDKTLSGEKATPAMREMILLHAVCMTVENEWVLREHERLIASGVDMMGEEGRLSELLGSLRRVTAHMPVINDMYRMLCRPDEVAKALVSGRHPILVSVENGVHPIDALSSDMMNQALKEHLQKDGKVDFEGDYPIGGINFECMRVADYLGAETKIMFALKQQWEQIYFCAAISALYPLNEFKSLQDIPNKSIVDAIASLTHQEIDAILAAAPHHLEAVDVLRVEEEEPDSDGQEEVVVLDNQFEAVDQVEQVEIVVNEAPQLLLDKPISDDPEFVALSELFAKAVDDFSRSKSIVKFEAVMAPGVLSNAQDVMSEVYHLIAKLPNDAASRQQRFDLLKSVMKETAALLEKPDNDQASAYTKLAGRVTRNAFSQRLGGLMTMFVGGLLSLVGGCVPGARLIRHGKTMFMDSYASKELRKDMSELSKTSKRLAKDTLHNEPKPKRRK